MQVYREGPAHPGLPFSRQHLLVYTLLVIGTSLFIPLMVVPIIVSPAFRDGGWGMYVLVLIALTITTTLAVLSAWLIRGRDLPILIAATLPSLPAVAGALLFLRPMAITTGVVDGSYDPSDVGSIDVNQAARILAEGSAEADALLMFGCALSAAAFLTLGVALLGGAASIDRGSASPAGRSSIAPLALGVPGVVATIAIRVIMHKLFAEVLFTVFAFVLVTILASVAARNGQFVRRWHDHREASGWLSSVLIAAVAAAAAVALMDVVAGLHAERTGLGAVASESLDFSQRVRVLLQTIEETRDAHLYAWVDGVLAFAIVGSALAGAMGRGPEGSLRTPLGAPSAIALGSVMAVVIAIVGVRAHARTACELAATANPAAHARRPALPPLDLPVVADVIAFETGESGGPTLIVPASGATTLSRPLLVPNYDQMMGGDTNIDVFADRKATWRDVAHAIREALGSKYVDGTVRLPRVSIQVVSTAVQIPARLDHYAVFLGQLVSAIQLRLEQQGEAEYPPPSVSAREDENMGAVVDHIAAVNVGHESPILRSPTGDWRR